MTIAGACRLVAVFFVCLFGFLVCCLFGEINLQLPLLRISKLQSCGKDHLAFGQEIE